VAVNLYVKIFLQLCTENAIKKRMNKLNTIKIQAWSPENSSTYNKLDQHITRLMHRAEKKCKKGLPKTYMWSEDLHEAGSQRSYWNALKQSLLPHRNISDRTLDIKRKMAKVPLHQEKPAEEINMELRKAKKTMKDIRKNHKEYREDHLKRKAAAIDEDKGKDPNKTSTLIQLIRHEENIQMWRTGKRHMGREIGRGLTEIMVPVNPNEIPTNETKEWRRESDLNKVTLAMLNVKLPQPQLRTRTYTQTSQNTLRATQVRSALSHAYAVTYQNRITDKP
jgi:hypothetical protein